MPYVFTTSYLPLNKTKEAAKIYVDTLKDYRAEVRGLRKEIVPNAVKARKDHIEVVGISEVKEGNLTQYLLLSQKYMTRYHDLGEGYGYDIEVRFKAAEALEMIGFKLPE